MTAECESAGFLSDFSFRPVQLKGAGDLKAEGLVLGQGPGALEVVVTRAKERPSSTLLRNVWRHRQGQRSVPLLIVSLYGGYAAVCGATGEEPPVYVDVDPSVAERVCATALQQPSRHAAVRFLYSVLPQMDSKLPGIRNEGFLTMHELEQGVPGRADFPEATEKARTALQHRGHELLDALGFGLERLDDHTYLLMAGQRRRAAALLLLPDEHPETASPRFAGLSPVSKALSVAEEHNVPYVLLLSSTGLRLHPVRDGVGVAQRGRTDTFVEANLDLIPADRAGYLWLLFSADALAENGALEDILKRARDHAVDVGSRLRERVYEKVVPKLAMAVWHARGITEPTAQDLSETYEMALLALFRLLFIAYAEDKDLLPYRTNEAYRDRSLKRRAHELYRMQRRDTEISAGTSYYDEIRTLWRAIDEGRPEWGVPLYNGQLFSRDAKVSPIGAKLEALSLPNNVFVPILQDLLIDEAPDEGIIGPVDFSDLGVREFGTIYEGLLENDLAIAETDLTVRRVKGRDQYWPAKKGSRKRTEVVVRKGQAYLHDASGARKATGSYFTKEFAVRHLLDHALEPAIAAHIRRLDDLDDDEAGRAFFDFRVADIAMGSGHFLVAAVDRIERHFMQYLSKRPLPGVREELGRLRAKAREALGPSADAVLIEDSQLLRRQIARRCIYGVDINPLAVQLARVSLWIHTFVPGLPLSFLDHNLVQGNSLVGMATIEEVQRELETYAPHLFSVNAQSLLGEAREPLERLGRITDADAREIAAARRAVAEAQEAIQPTAALLNILSAARLDQELADKLEMGRGKEDLLGNWMKDLKKTLRAREHRQAAEIHADLAPFHFPIAFPEVFLRDSPGFDCILGNPPWEEATVEEDRFWTRHFPGLHSLSEREKQRQIGRYRQDRPDLVAEYERERSAADRFRAMLVAGPFPGMGTGDPDVYKAFCWRFWQLLRAAGRMGAVLPRSAFAVKGSAAFRERLFREGLVDDLTFLLNRGRWVFEDQHPQYTIALASVAKTQPAPGAVLSLRGPYASLSAFEMGVRQEPLRFPVDDVRSWTDTAALPLLPDEEAGEVFLQLCKAPRLDLDDGQTWRARPYRELDATNDKSLMDVRSKTCPEGYWPVFKGESFDIWQADTGTYYAWANPKRVTKYLQDKRVRSGGMRKSPFSEFPPEVLRDPDTLPCLRPRIAFRDVTNRTNQRTVVVALVPANVFITNAAPYVLWPRGDAADQAYLLGLLSSIPLDWYSRRFVELHLNYHIFNSLPVPRPSRDDALWQRVVALSGRLAAPDERFAEWAEAVGVEWGPLAEDEKDDMIAELDAVVAHLYGLTERQLVHIFETFHEGWDYTARLEAVLKHYREWA